MPIMAPTVDVNITPKMHSEAMMVSTNESSDSAKPASARGFIFECI